MREELDGFACRHDKRSWEIINMYRDLLLFSLYAVRSQSKAQISTRLLFLVGFSEKQ